MKHVLSIVLLLLAFAEINAGAKLNRKEANQLMRANRFSEKDERIPAFKRRLGATFVRTLGQRKNLMKCQNNGDEQTVAGFAAQFSKTLEHDPATGLLTQGGQDNYRQLVTALSTGKQADFNAIQRFAGASRLINPQGGNAFSFEGADASSYCLPHFPKLSSPEAAAQMLEDYAMMLCRDVLFSEYGTGLDTDSYGNGRSLTNDAASVLQSLGAAYHGPRDAQGGVDAAVVFRGVSYGNNVGPYISQFLFLPILTNLPAGIGSENLSEVVFVVQEQLRPIAGPREFGTTISNFVAIQNGLCPQKYIESDYDTVHRRYIVTGRDLASYVHYDTPIEAFLNAATILFSNKFPLSAASPYLNGTIKNEGPFVTFGLVDAYAMIGGVASEAFKATWCQKWRGQRALRPEAFGGLVNNAKMTGTNPFNLDASLFQPHAGIDVLALVLQKNQQNLNPGSTYLLSQVYPEGSPAHPSYPGGHAAVAGACVTILKAIFDDRVTFSTRVKPVIPNPLNPAELILLTNGDENKLLVGSELDKLAANMSFGRNIGGIHYRIDDDQGILFGEKVAIKYLQDRAATISEETFTGYELTKLNGERIRITASAVISLS